MCLCLFQYRIDAEKPPKKGKRTKGKKEQEGQDEPQEPQVSEEDVSQAKRRGRSSTKGKGDTKSPNST